jgi:hypothetical protein
MENCYRNFIDIPKKNHGIFHVYRLTGGPGCVIVSVYTLRLSARKKRNFIPMIMGFPDRLGDILVIHALARAMWITPTGSRIMCLWVAVALMWPVQVR